MPAASKFDDVAPEILRNLQACLPPDVACELAGVARSTFYDWLKRGREAKSGKYRQFALDVEQAKASAESRLVASIAAAATNREKPDVKAAMFLLERMHPARWARPGVAARPAAPPAAAGSEPDDDGWDLDNVTPLRGAG
ncbi:hypothetical protein SK069_05820 [Patulibacter brassicae]|uniref:Helix-turn-helix domain-containing protein n=1 Tax=Patulibacter brassicae TaxID=1705717 RepID=A0ABU4VH06_9ACTN|nr:hypothetical protein [Patulibacter brassicae]MDX8151102.1 hypothetical protein [Patulibacter brassicae]